MTSEQKKAFLLLKAIIFSYHGLDEDEKRILDETAEKLSAFQELEWALNFLNEDVLTAFDRGRAYFNTTIATYDNETKLSYLNMVWDATKLKGYITEMEAMAMLKLAKDWGVQKELLGMVRK
ncbi:MAG: hypothetical protein ACK4ND_15805 [Cytophagaceae bacterium]